MVKLAVLSITVAAAVATVVAQPARSAQKRCDTYGYAGLVAPGSESGIAADVTALAAPHVAWGHVAAWLGVGGSGRGPSGSDEWLQVGLSGFEGGVSALYYEVERPGAAPAYHELRPGVAIGESHQVAVLEVSHRPGVWRVWLDGSPASPPIQLAGSHRRWTPMAMTESWNGGHGVCNGFRYAFSGLRVATAPGGSWQRLRNASLLERDQHVIERRGNAFVAAGA